jgi:hypothetical protein
MEAVRTQIDPNAKLPMRRTFLDRVLLRWPGLFAAFSRAAVHLPRRSRLRRELTRINALQGWGAWVRGDLDMCVVRFAPDYHYDPPREWLIPGMPTVYRGHAGLRQWAADLHEAWEFVDHTPLEIADGGSVVAFLCRVRLRGRTSGIELDSHLGQVFWIERGLIVRETDFGTWDEALRAAKLPPPTESASPER